MVVDLLRNGLSIEFEIRRKLRIVIDDLQCTSDGDVEGELSTTENLLCPHSKLLKCWRIRQPV